MVCPECGSQFSSIDDVETFCATCLLRTALSDEDIDAAARPRRFDQYELITGDDDTPVELGRGAMGVTYKAFDTNLRCEVALKVIHPRYLADESSRARFLSEARAAAQMRHRNIASVFHLGSERGEYFYAMEVLEGETIEQRVLRKGPIDCVTSLDITLQITRALIATGSRRFVHRDIKPSNIMLCSEADGAIVAKLIDFGLVRAIADQAVRGDDTPTRDGFIGTPHFASPEQFGGHPTDVRSDIFSLGVTLWFMLTGKVPFDGTREEIHQKQLIGALPLDQLKGTPRAVIDFLKPLLEVNPAKRPQSPVVLKEQLNKCIATIDVAKQKQRRLVGYVSLVAAVIIISVLAVSYAFQRKLVPITASEILPGKSIAVLPFENLSDDEEHAYFADGVQDDILTKLAKVAELKVISRTSVMRYRGRQDSRQIGHELGVSHVVEGTVRRSGAKVHVNVQLVDARTDTQVWAEEYDRDLNEVFAIESELTQSIATHLTVRVSAREQTSVQERPTTDLVAYDLYAHATSLLDESLSHGSLTNERSVLRAVELLNQAIARDPAFLLAYCKLAWAQDMIYWFDVDHTASRLDLAKSAITSAFRLKSDSGEAHLALALHLYHGYFDYDHARDELVIALRTMPNDPRILEYSGLIDRRQGRWYDAVRNLRWAIDLDPRNPRLNFEAAFTSTFSRQYKQAREIADRGTALSSEKNYVPRLMPGWIAFHEQADTRQWHSTLEQILKENPASPGDLLACERFFLSVFERNPVAAEPMLSLLDDQIGARGVGTFVFIPAYARGLVARMKGDSAGAYSAFSAAWVQQEKIVRADPSDGSKLCLLGLIDAGLGRKEEALYEGRRAVELLPVTKDALDGTEVLYFSSVICAWAGARDEAIQKLQTLAKLPAGLSYGDVRLDPHWDPLRGDPRFEKIVASLAPK